MGDGRRVLVVAAMLGMLAAGAPARAQAVVTITVDASTAVGTINRDLGGLGWHTGGAPLSTVEALHPHLVRLDASLQDVSPSPGVLRLNALLARVAQVRAIGAEPLVILSYMPRWLGEPRASGRDPTRVAPADADAWEDVVHDVVLRLATAPAPARRFEAWNEPDVPLFWQDTPQSFADTMVRSARAVARVESETGHDLIFGGPATAVPDPVYLTTFLSAFRDPALPLDFVSWHYYGNLPFFGPDGTEFGETEPIQPVIGRPNPLTSPSAFGPQTDLMRQTATVALAGSGRPVPPMLLDEWNLSSGGFDLRHDTHVGAAFDAGVLAELQDSGLDASVFFRVNDTRTTGGDHGLVFTDGRRKPAWWTFWLWDKLAAGQLPTTGTSEGLWAVASRSSGDTDAARVTVLVSSFSVLQPAARTVAIDVGGLSWTPASATVRRIDADHADAGVAVPLAVDGTRVTLDLPAQAVAFVELRPATGASPAGASPPALVAPPAGASPPAVQDDVRGGGALPTTGGGGAVLGVALGAVALVLHRWVRRRGGQWDPSEAGKAVTPPR